jgi:hypothetical protein
VHAGAWIVSLCLLQVLLVARARAQALPEVTYDAPASCPERAEFERRVRARVRTDLDGAERRRAALRRIEVRIELRTGRALGQLVMHDAAGTAATRRIVAASCLEAVDALALIAALTIDPGSAAEPSPEPRSTSEPADTARLQPQPEPQPEPSAQAEQLPAPEREADSVDRATEPTPRETRATVPEPSVEDRADSDEAPASPSRASTRVGLFTSAVALTGVAPSAQPALQLSAALAWSPEGAFELLARAGVRLTPEQSTSTPEGVATFAFWTSIAALCAGARIEAQHAALALCADFELGRMTARGRETLNGETSRRTWTALGPAVLAHWEGLDPVVIQAGAELLFALVRDRFLLGPAEVHHVPAVGLRAELGVGIQLR